jgi:hypothetical protein
LWRCGNRGNVASVLIEKPARGDFLPVVDGGFSLQYSPLLEYRENQGMVLFCQLDVTGRTEVDPVAERLTVRALEYVSAWKPAARRKVVYAGAEDSRGTDHLDRTGIPWTPYRGGELAHDQVLVVGPGGARQLAGNAAEIAKWLDRGGHVLALGLDEPDAQPPLPGGIQMRRAEHIATWFEPRECASLLAGVAPADVHNPAPCELPLVVGQAAVGNGVLGQSPDANVVYCQIVPTPAEQRNLKRTYRRASCLVTRILANMGVAGSTPLLERFASPVPSVGQSRTNDTDSIEGRWAEGLYVDIPEEWDDPYRFFRW